MQISTKSRRKPSIRISKSDYERLSALASSIAASKPDVADELSAEIERARIVSDRAMPQDVVRMGSRVTFTADTGSAKTVTLVFPGQADIAEGRISILTPVGTALIGLAAGQSISWTARDGKRHELSILAVDQPGPEVSSRTAPSSETVSVGE